MQSDAQGWRSAGEIKVPRMNPLRSPQFLCCLVLALPSQALAQAMEGQPTNGTFATSVDIDVPAYFGLEPDLSLAYHSGRDDGFVGVGWTLGGQSYIERASPGPGAPSYTDADVFLIDGEELVPCTILGGTHCTKRQSYRRIKKDWTTDRWYIWDKEGTRSTYAATYVTGSGTFRWALITEEDTNGNVVTYGYFTDPFQNVYLDTIRYNGVGIKLWREDRTDDVSFANGVTVGVSRYRLKTIDVTVGGQRARAYKLEYSYGPNTGRSRLQKVTRYGSDAQLDSAGTVVGGTALPAHTFTYDAGGAGYPLQSWNSTIGIWETEARYLFGDVNGDGRTDEITIYRNAGDNQAYAAVNQSNGAGFASVAFNAKIGGWSPEVRDFVVDINGDGKSDLVRIYEHPSGKAYAQVNLSDGRGFSSPSFNSSVGGWNPDFKDGFADVNGDGKADLIRIWGGPGGDAFAQVNLSNGRGFSAASFNSSVGGWSPTVKDSFADVNGDGKADLVRIWRNGDGTAWGQINLSNGAGFPSQSGNSSIGGWNDQTQDFFPDVNGDGKSDLVRIYHGSTGSFAQVNLSTGHGFAATSWNSSIGGWDPTLIRDYFVDVNGDKRADSVRIYKSGTGSNIQVRLSSGVGYPSNVWNGPIGGWDPARIRDGFADVNGDGKMDLVRVFNNGTTGNRNANAQVNLSAGGAFPDLLTSSSNGLGGKVSVAYVPSSNWDNSYLPVGSVLPTVAALKTEDGRGVSNTASYYYLGGLWSDGDRQFLGFRYERATIDALGTTRETYYSQSAASAGAPLELYLKDNRGSSYHYVRNTYTENSSTLPYTAPLTRVQTFVYNQTGVSNEIRSEFAYDVYGNLTRTIDHGYFGETGDERTQVNAYAYNTSAYIVGLPSSSTTYAGTQALAENQRDDVRNLYDQATAASVPPTRGNLTRTERWDSKTGGYVVTSQLQYDAYGNVTRRTDARGQSTSTTFDATYHQFPTQVTNALGHTVTTDWNTVLGLATAVIDANGAAIRTTYDALGQKRSTVDAANAETRWDYLDTGNPALQRVRTTRPDGSGDGLWSETYHDGLSRTYRVVREGPSAGVTFIQDTVFADATNRPRRTSLPYATGQMPLWTTLAYDGMGRQTSSVLPDGKSSTVAYTNTSSGKSSILSTDELGHRQSINLDAYGRRHEVAEQNGAAQYLTTFHYDVVGHVVQTIDAKGNITGYSYDSLGNKIAMTDPDMGTLTYAYDGGGLLLSQRDARNQLIAFTHDALGRMATKVVNGQPHTRWFYDEAGHGSSTGRLTRVLYPAGGESYSWNLLGLETARTQTIGSVGRTMATAYDALARPRTLTYPDGEVVTYVYDGAGDLRSVGSSRGGSYVSSMTWNPAGQSLAMTFGNGTTTSYSYDPNRAWLSSVAMSRNGAALYNATYQYDAAGRVVATSQDTRPTAKSLSYSYDDLGRLLTVGGAQSQSFTYDAIGNLTSNSRLGAYRYDDAAHKHAVTAAGSGLSYTYDANGNRLSGDGKTYVWDAEDQLVSVTDEEGVTTAFEYGIGGNRLKKTQGSKATLFFSPTVEQVNGADVQYYYAGPMLVAKRNLQSGARAFYHADRLGSTRLMTNDQGLEVKEYDYQPFGSVDSTAGAEDNERGFTGHVTDAEDGLVYMQTRHHDPKLGSFLSADSIVPETGSPQGYNAYSYCANNPVNNVDPTGHAPLGSFLPGGLGPLLPPSTDDAAHQRHDTVRNRVRSVGNSIRNRVRKATARLRERREDMAAKRHESVGPNHGDTIIRLPGGIYIQTDGRSAHIWWGGKRRSFAVFGGLILTEEGPGVDIFGGIKKDKDGHSALDATATASTQAIEVQSATAGFDTRRFPGFLASVLGKATLQSSLRFEGPSAVAQGHLGRDGLVARAGASSAAVSGTLRVFGLEFEGGLSQGPGAGISITPKDFQVDYGPATVRMPTPFVLAHVSPAGFAVWGVHKLF
jgi:RHS repeat-associated protein